MAELHRADAHTVLTHRVFLLHILTLTFMIETDAAIISSFIV